MALRNRIGDRYDVFFPILILHEADSLQLLGIIGVIVYGNHGAEAVESLHKHTFFIHIGKAHRPVEHVHSLAFSPFGNGVE